MGHLTFTMCNAFDGTLQYAVPTVYGRDQSPGVPWGADGDGAVFYRVRVRSGVLGRVLHKRRYVIFLFPHCLCYPPDCTFMTFSLPRLTPLQ